MCIRITQELCWQSEDRNCIYGAKSNHRRLTSGRSGAALLLAIFVMAIVSSLVVAIADAQTLRYAALRNTTDWDSARYLAEAGLHDALSRLETDINWRTGIGTTEYPANSGRIYSVAVQDGPDGTVIISATGSTGAFSRVLTATIKHGG
ncbi:MAG: hypothetical protein KDB22_02805 [Planctomycetales bacterium]|nr:hypothetical protein [Planctomycetales bacterium]